MASVPDTGSIRHGFCITSPQRSFTLLAANAREKEAWVLHLSKACGTDASGKGEERRSGKEKKERNR